MQSYPALERGDKRITTYVTENTKTDIEDFAKRKGIPVAVYVRQSLAKQLAKDRIYFDDL